jgi:hypothetical protein
MMRIASALLVAVLLTTCAISGTFAKYVTSASSHDSARVAHWGFKETTFTIDDLFEKAYTNVGASADVIAPGTEGESTFSFKPMNATAPEVAYKIIVTTDGSKCDDDLIANTNIQWKLDTTGSWGSFDDLLKAIQDLSTGTIPAQQFDTNWGAESTHTVYWQWLINESSDVNDEQNIKDTALGSKAGEDWVTLKITILAEQVD